MRRFFRLAVVAVFLLSLLAGGLFLYGGRQYQFTAQVTLDASPSEVFRYLADETLVTQWVEGLREIEALNDDEPGVGARARLVLEENGRRIEMTDQVLESVPGVRLKSRTTSSTFQSLSVYLLENQQEDTLVRLLMFTTHQGVFRIVAPFVQSQIQQKVESDLRRLKSLVESSQSAGADPSSTPAGDPLN